MPRNSLVIKCCIILIIVCGLVYANTLQNGYVFDDGLVISENTIVKQGVKGIPELFATPHMRGRLIAPNDMYRPLSLVMFAIEYELFGLNPVAGHLLNMLTFIGCVLVLFTFLDKLLVHKRTVTAFIAALLFAVHPIHTEVVANIKSRDELLCFLFAFLSLNVFMSYMKKGNPTLLLLGCFTLFLSYLSKETVVSFLGIIPVLFFFYYKDNKFRAIYITTGTVAVTIIFIIIRAFVLNKYNANQPAPIEFMDNALSHAPSLVSRLVTEVVILGKYLKLMFIPYPLFSNYSYNSIPFAHFSDIGFWLSLAAYDFLVYVVISGWMKRRDDPWAFGVFFYLSTIFLFTNIPFLMGAEMAERFAFFPSVGFCLVIALIIERSVMREEANDVAILKNVKVLAVLIPVVLIFSSLAIARNMDWKSNYTLFKGDAERSGKDSRLYLYATVAMLNNITPETDSATRNAVEDDCIIYLRKALAIYPGYSNVYEQMSDVYEHKHMTDSAETYERKSLETGTPDGARYNAAGNKYFTMERYPIAVYCFEKAISVAPGVKFPYFTLAHTFLKMKKYDSSVYYFKKSISIDPSYVEAHEGIAVAYNQEQNFDSAEYHIKQAIALSPGNAAVLNSLGALYFNFKKFQQAIEQYKKTIMLDKNNIDAYSCMGLAYYSMGQYDSAINAFNKEISIDQNVTRDISYLANAYKHAGNIQMAIKYEAIARQLFPDFKLE